MRIRYCDSCMFYQHINEWVDATQFPKLMRRMSSTLMNPNLLGAYLLMILSVSISYLLVYWKGLTNKILSKAYKKQIYMMIPVALILFVTFSSVVFPNTTNGPPNNKYVSKAISVTTFMITRFLAIVMNLLRRFLHYFQ